MIYCSANPAIFKKTERIEEVCIDFNLICKVEAERIITADLRTHGAQVMERELQGFPIALAAVHPVNVKDALSLDE